MAMLLKKEIQMGVLLETFHKFRGLCVRSREGIESPWAPIYSLIDHCGWHLFHKKLRLRYKNNVRHFKKKYAKYITDGCYNFDGIKLPFLDADNERLLLGSAFVETLSPYLFYGNHFYETLHKKYHQIFYGFEKEGFDVTVKPDDVVIDAGSWIGDFAAYASHCGATVYAFEPVPDVYDLLTKTAKLNAGIIPVQLGLGDSGASIPMYVGSGINAMDSTFCDSIASTRRDNLEKIYLKITKLDDYVAENNIKRVDFIKSDIEGLERNMLKGARQVLKQYAPKLAISTYHLPDDPQVIEKNILEANPRYNIIHMYGILFATVPLSTG
jgi:FkbM family methyltransferase